MSDLKDTSSVTSIVGHRSIAGPVASAEPTRAKEVREKETPLDHSPEKETKTREQIIGAIGEELVKNWLEKLNQLPNINYEVHRISDDHRRAGYDIQLRDLDKDERICIEVKTQMPGNGDVIDKRPDLIYLTGNEKRQADYYLGEGARYYIARVTDLDESNKSGVTRLYNYGKLGQDTVKAHEYRIRFNNKAADHTETIALDEELQKSIAEVIPTTSKTKKTKKTKKGLKTKTQEMLTRAVSRIIDSDRTLHTCTEAKEMAAVLINDSSVLAAVQAMLNDLGTSGDIDSEQNTSQISKEENDTKVANDIKAKLLESSQIQKLILDQVISLHPEDVKKRAEREKEDEHIYKRTSESQHFDIKYSNTDNAHEILVDININFKNSKEPSKKLTAEKMNRITSISRNGNQHYICFNFNIDTENGTITVDRYQIEEAGDLAKKFGTKGEAGEARKVEVSKYKVTLPDQDHTAEITKINETTSTKPNDKTTPVASAKARTGANKTHKPRPAKTRKNLDKLELRGYQRKTLAHLLNNLKANANHKLRTEVGDLDINSTLLLGNSGLGKTSILARAVLERLTEDPEQRFLITLPPRQFPFFKEALLRQCENREQRSKIEALISEIHTPKIETAEDSRIEDLSDKNIILLSSSNTANYNDSETGQNLGADLTRAIDIRSIDNFFLDSAHLLSSNEEEGNGLGQCIKNLLAARREANNLKAANIIGATSPFYHQVDSENRISQLESEQLFSPEFLEFFPEDDNKQTWVKMPKIEELIEAHNIRQAQSLDIIDIDSRPRNAEGTPLPSVSLKTYSGETRDGDLVSEPVQLINENDAPVDLNEEIAKKYNEVMASQGYKKVVILCHSYPQIDLLKNKLGSGTNVIPMNSSTEPVDALNRFEESEGKTVLLMNASQFQGGIYPKGVDGLIVSEMTTKSHKFARMMGIAHAKHGKNESNECPVIYVHCPYAEKTGNVFLNQASIRDKGLREGESTGSGDSINSEVDISDVKLSDAFHTNWQNKLRGSFGANDDESYRNELGPFLDDFIDTIKNQKIGSINLNQEGARRLVKEIIEGNRIDHQIFREFVTYAGFTLDDVIAKFPLFTGIYPRDIDPENQPGLNEAQLIFNEDNYGPIFSGVDGKSETTAGKLNDFLSFEIEDFGIKLSDLVRIAGINEQDLEQKLEAHLDAYKFNSSIGETKKLYTKIKQLIMTALIMDKIWGFDQAKYYQTMFRDGKLRVRITEANGQVRVREVLTQPFIQT